jgi:periplasmic copper chaperone A
MIRTLQLTCAACLLTSATLVMAENTLEIDDAYVRQPIPGKNMSAAFMTIRNTSAADQTLVSASAEWANTIEIHTHTHEDGVMRMRQIADLPLPAGETVTLQPGGLHLMLFGLAAELPAKPALELCFADQHCQSVTAELRDMR